MPAPAQGIGAPGFGVLGQQLDRRQWARLRKEQYVRFIQQSGAIERKRRCGKGDQTNQQEASKASGHRSPCRPSAIVQGERGQRKGGDADILELSRTAQLGQIDDRGCLMDVGAHAPNQLRGCQQRAASGDQIVEQHH